jgi:hypothetical protein
MPSRSLRFLSFISLKIFQLFQFLLVLRLQKFTNFLPENKILFASNKSFYNLKFRKSHSKTMQLTSFQRSSTHKQSQFSHLSRSYQPFSLFCTEVVNPFFGHYQELVPCFSGVRKRRRKLASRIPSTSIVIMF